MTGLQHHPVPSGSYYVGPQKPILLQAFLGTCVGVVLFDHQVGIGGIFHILLPEPPTPGSIIDSQRYATTGMPEFIEAMLKAGARLENLKAVLAGGALVGPVSDQDLALDIGGRTVEVVRRILDESRIPIEYSETGGFFTCVMDLNLKDGQYRVEPTGQGRYDSQTPAVAPELGDINQIVAQVQPIPQVALKVMRIIDEQTYDIESIAAEVQKDQVITGRTLQICNSAIFAKKRKIESLDHALVYLGQDLFVKYVISAAVKNYFNPTTQGYSLCQGGLYHHAVGTAIIAEKIARFTGQTRPATAYTAGLLHDIGKVVLDQFVADAYPLFYRKYSQCHDNLTRIEKDILGYDHTEVGSQLACQWSLPESLQEAIAFHHWPGKAPMHKDLSNIVFLADLLMSWFNTGLEMERLDAKNIVAVLNGIGIEKQDFAKIIDLIPGKVLSDTPEQALDAAA